MYALSCPVLWSWFDNAEYSVSRHSSVGAETSWEAEPNTSIVPFDAAFPGTLPVSMACPITQTNSLRDRHLLRS